MEKREMEKKRKILYRGISAVDSEQLVLLDFQQQSKMQNFLAHKKLFQKV